MQRVSGFGGVDVCCLGLFSRAWVFLGVSMTGHPEAGHLSCFRVSVYRGQCRKEPKWVYGLGSRFGGVYPVYRR